MIPQCEPSFGSEETAAVTRYMQSGGWVTEHRVTRGFERAICEYTGAKHCVVTTSGTAALMLCGMALGIGPGDEVIVPAYSMIATANAFRALGARVVFCDVEEDTLCLSSFASRSAATDRTRAVVIMNANGRTREPVWDINGQPIIEDACQALGSRYPDGTHCGRKGLMGTLSFSVPKIVSTGQGGAVITDDDEMALRLLRAKDFGRATGGTDVHPHFGLNFKFTDLQAAIGLAQMAKLPERVLRKQRMWCRYWNELAPVGLHTRLRQHGAIEIPWFIEFHTDRREALQGFLSSRGIGTRVMYPPIPHQDCYRDGGSYPVAERVGREGLWLPSSVGITDEQIDEVCAAIREFYRC